MLIRKAKIRYLVGIMVTGLTLAGCNTDKLTTDNQTTLSSSPVNDKSSEVENNTKNAIDSKELSNASTLDTKEDRTVYAMDTVMTLTVYGDNAAKALDAAEAEIYRLDALLNRGSKDSEIYKLNEARQLEVSDDVKSLISCALEVGDSVDGAFDITIADMMDLWGFYTKEFHVPTEDELSKTLAKTNYKDVVIDGNKVSLQNEVKIDLGGIAKGYLSSRIMDIFKENEVTSAIVSLGGNVEALNTKPNGDSWKVAIQNPNDDSFIGGVAIENKAVITSGGYQRYFEQDGKVYHHIIDPSTGYPADNNLKSVTIISEDGTKADALSTSLFVLGLDKAIEYYKEHDGFEAVFIDNENNIYATENAAFESNLPFEIIKK